MKFSVSRTSLWNNSSPCEEAVKHDDHWIIEFEDLTALSHFVRKYGQVILAGSDLDPDDDLLGIEIYDDYRE